VQSSHRKNWAFECRRFGIGERPTQLGGGSPTRSRVYPHPLPGLRGGRELQNHKAEVRGGRLGHTTGLLRSIVVRKQEDNWRLHLAQGNRAE
jgi:hypothetical protein